MFRLLLSASKKVLRDDEIVKSVAADRERAQGLSEDCDMANFKLPLNSFHVIPQWFEEHPTSETKFCKVGSINLEQYLSTPKSQFSEKLWVAWFSLRLFRRRRTREPIRQSGVCKPQM